jgi:D-beta-D-heptose 7-phosphate kinase/D-beta-D-heptose 1-phosphate adenosyltransferase
MDDVQSKKCILVVGDSMADHYVYGKVERVSKEAPIPIVEYQYEEYHLGGAANVAANIVSMKNEVMLCSLVGNDAEGQRIRGIMQDKGINLDLLVHEEGRPTSTKTRVIAGNKVQVFRMDRESRGRMDPDKELELLGRIESILNDVDLIVLADYGKGFLSSKFVSYVVRLGKRRGKKVICSLRSGNPQPYYGAYLIKPDIRDLGEWAGMEINSVKDAEIAMQKMKSILKVENVMVDRSEYGLLLLDANYRMHKYENTCDNLVDITGAGATIMAVLGAFLAGGTDIEKSCKLACLAAGIKKGKLGTAIIDLEELEELKDYLDHKKE